MCFPKFLYVYLAKVNFMAACLTIKVFILYWFTNLPELIQNWDDKSVWDKYTSFSWTILPAIVMTIDTFLNRMNTNYSHFIMPCIVVLKKNIIFIWANKDDLSDIHLPLIGARILVLFGVMIAVMYLKRKWLEKCRAVREIKIRV